MAIRWYADESGKVAFDAARAALAPIIGELFPNVELTHMGFHRNEMTEEVVVKLHFNPLGSVRVVPDSEARRLR